MICSGCSEVKYSKKYSATEWKKYDTPDQGSVLCKDCKAQKEHAEYAAWGHACGKCARRFETEQGRDAHEEDCGLTEAQKEEKWQAAYAAWGHPCGKCARRFGTLQGLHAHEEGCKLKVEKERHAVPEPAKPKGGIARAEEGMQAMPVNRRWGRRGLAASSSAECPAASSSAAATEVWR